MSKYAIITSVYYFIFIIWGAEMKLAKSGSVFNMGDTSVRVQEVVEVNRLILKVLSGFVNRIPNW